MLLRKLLCIVVSCVGSSTEASLGKKEAFSEDFASFYVRWIICSLGENCIIVWSRLGKLHLSKTELLESVFSLHYFPYSFLSSLLTQKQNKCCVIHFGLFLLDFLFFLLSGSTLDTLLRKIFVGELQV